jgi:hypothetical protein
MNLAEIDYGVYWEEAKLDSIEQNPKSIEAHQMRENLYGGMRKFASENCFIHFFEDSS